MQKLYCSHSTVLALLLGMCHIHSLIIIYDHLLHSLTLGLEPIPAKIGQEASCHIVLPNFLQAMALPYKGREQELWGRVK